MSEKKKSQIVVLLAALLVVVLFGGVLFVGAVSGWFSDPKVTLDEEYYAGDADSQELMDLSVQGYEDLIQNKKSFVVFIDQNGCKTAERLNGFIKDYMAEKGISVYKMMFSDVKESSLHEEVKYYPSVVIVSKGKPVAWLRADSDEDADAYNKYEAFLNWIGKYI